MFLIYLVGKVISPKLLAPQEKKVEVTEEDIKAVVEQTGISEEVVKKAASLLESAPRLLSIPKTIACLRCKLMLPIPILTPIRRAFWCLLCTVLSRIEGSTPS